MRHIKSSKPHHPNPADLSDRSAACPPGRENSPFALASPSPFAFVSHNICHPVSWIKSSCADCSAGTMATTTQIKTQLSEMKSKWIRTSKSSVHLGLQFCLSTSQITRISLGLPGSSEHRGHLKHLQPYLLYGQHSSHKCYYYHWANWNHCLSQSVHLGCKANLDFLI